MAGMEKAVLDCIAWIDEQTAKYGPDVRVRGIRLIDLFYVELYYLMKSDLTSELNRQSRQVFLTTTL